MSAALQPPPRSMAVEEFLAWEPPAGDPDRWILRDGVPEMTGTPGQAHGAIQAELAYRLTAHLRDRDMPCRVLTAGGVIPAFRRQETMLSPALAVTCDPACRQHAIPNPVVLIEILSPSDARATHAAPLRAAYRTAGPA